MFTLELRKRLAVSLSMLLALLHTMGIPSARAEELFSKKCQQLPAKAWTPYLSKQYAHSQMKVYNWNRSEYKALVKLWQRESQWKPNAFNKNPDRWSGKKAGGIPQILGMDPSTPAPLQIGRGLDYIQTRYGKPSVAWAHHRAHGWY